MAARFFIFLALCFWLSTPAWADDPPHHSQARMFSAVKAVGQGDTVDIGIEIKLEQGWDTYWRTPGEAGLAPVFDWKGSTNVKSAKILWPAPKRFVAFDIDNFGYKDIVTFPVEITAQKAGAPVSISLKLDLLVCGTLCVPETHRLTLAIPAGEAEVTPDHETLAAAIRQVPLADDQGNFSVQNAWLEDAGNKKIFLHVNAMADNSFDPVDMFVEHPNYYMTVDKPLFSYNAETKKLRIDAPVRAYEPIEDMQKKMQKNPLVLTVTGTNGAFERHVPLGGKQAAHPAKEFFHAVKEHADLTIMLLAFVGGLILNLMPCVLPVLSLKVLSVLKHGGKDHHIHRWEIFQSFMASALGILFSFWVMAGALVALKASGETIGWGIQFQHPAFLIFLIVVLTVFAANMWGFFDIPLPRFIAKNFPVRHEHEPTFLGNFLTGAFATLLATPCTAPFLGTAVGFALARDAVDIFAVFTFLGIGLAYPYMLLALVPQVFKYMPKPGRWMIALRKVLALSLALTAIWLINVLVTVTTQPTLDNGWTKFDESLIRPAVEEGRTVIVDVTADWCLTCKANKRLVLEQDDVEDAISVPNVLRLQADWTHHDETIAAYLRKDGRYGIPFNIVYGPGAPGGIILSELLTKREVMRALSEAADE